MNPQPGGSSRRPREYRAITLARAARRRRPERQLSERRRPQWRRAGRRRRKRQTIPRHELSGGPELVAPQRQLPRTAVPTVRPERWRTEWWRAERQRPKRQLSGNGGRTSRYERRRAPGTATIRTATSPNGVPRTRVAGGSGGVTVMPNASAPFVIPTDIGGKQVPAVPPPPPVASLPAIPTPSFPSLEAEDRGHDRPGRPDRGGPRRDRGRSRTHRRCPRVRAGAATAAAAAAAATPSILYRTFCRRRVQGPRSSPGRSVDRLLGSRDFIHDGIDVVDAEAILTPPGRAFDFSDPAAVGQLVTALKKIADARQGTVRPGESPYRVLIRFRVAWRWCRELLHPLPGHSGTGFPMSREESGR